MSTPDTGCLSCVDGMAPTTTQLLGACYRTCPSCQPPCACCHGEGSFPAWTSSLTAFVDSYNSIGLLPVLCHTCLGIIAVTLLNEQEVDS